MRLLLQVSEKYVRLVTSINNADTLITLIVPSVMIIFSNVRISVAMSQFHRDRQVMLAREQQTQRTSAATAAAAAAAATQRSSSSSSSQRRSLRHQTSVTLTPADDSHLTGSGSFNRLQMKVSLTDTGEQCSWEKETEGEWRERKERGARDIRVNLLFLHWCFDFLLLNLLFRHTLNIGLYKMA